MKEFNYESLRRKITEDFDSKMKHLGDQKTKALETLEKMRSLMDSLNTTMAESERVSSSTTNGHAPKTPKKLLGGVLKTLLKEAIEDAPDKFDRHELVSHLESKYPGIKLHPVSVIYSLKSLVKNKFIRVVEPSKMNRPTVYGKI